MNNQLYEQKSKTLLLFKKIQEFLNALPCFGQVLSSFILKAVNITSLEEFKTRNLKILMLSVILLQNGYHPDPSS
uniref:Uncharacterized protein n=1 Tax=Romanomermis culicivorax TaxID=13658 RepID=A0A915KZP4_ROMCU